MTQDHADATAVQAEPFGMRVDLSKVREMSKALGMEAPLDEDGLVPLTFLTTMRHWITPDSDAWRHLGFVGPRVLHASEEYEFHAGPLRIGTRLQGHSRIDSRYTKTNKAGQQLTFAVMVTDYRDDEGALVATARLTGVELPEVSA